jgi:hypothetical protein
MADGTTPLMAAVFQNMEQAKQAYDALRDTGFGDDYLGLADPQLSIAGIGDTLKNTGVPAEENEFYKREFDRGHPLVTCRVGGVPEESVQKAITILRNFGAYDARSRDTHEEEFASNVNRDANSPFFDLTAKKEEDEPN